MAEETDLRTKFKKVWTDPAQFLAVFRTRARRVNQRFYSVFGNPGDMDVMDEDWDTLVILDACRYDIFAECIDHDGTLSAKLSPGTESWEFMQRSFVGRQLHDTVYVTTNPYAQRLPDGTFHAVINLLDEDWDEKLGTVPPEVAATRGIKAHERYPDKRIIVHFMQPHFPFLGPTGRKFEHQGVAPSEDDVGATDRPNPWRWLIASGDITPETVIEAYHENLELTWPKVERLCTAVTGKVVVTSDHGNLLGERTFPIPVATYGHPRSIYRRELLEVPWLELEAKQRRQIRADPPEEIEQQDEDTVAARLRDLGYVE